MDSTLTQLSEVSTQGDSILVVSYPGRLSIEQTNRMCAILAQRFPERKFLVLDGGATVQDTAAATRTEAKVDLVLAMLRRLLESVAEEEPADAVARSLDGGPAFHERDQNEPLG